MGQGNTAVIGNHTMPTFADNVFKVFALLQSGYRFVPARPSSDKRFASLVRKEADDIFVYVLVHDGRPGHSNLNIDIWVAPPDEPGDGLDSLYVGYKVRIGSEFNIDDQFFLNCEARIITFLTCVPAMIPAIRSELQNPAFRTLRWTSYMMERRVLAALLRAAGGGDQIIREAVDAAAAAAAGKRTLDEITDSCIAAATQMIERGDFDHDILDRYRGDGKKIGMSVAGHVYANALGELSAAMGVPDQRVFGD
jgi:hypothetical protein